MRKLFLTSLLWPSPITHYPLHLHPYIHSPQQTVETLLSIPSGEAILLTYLNELNTFTWGIRSTDPGQTFVDLELKTSR